MLATWRSVAMPVMGKSKVPPESAKLQVAALEQHGKKMGHGKLGEITLIAEAAPLPEGPTRAVFDAAVPRISPYYGAVSAVFEGTGFRAALVRGVVVSFQLLSRTKFPQKTFGDVEECSQWMFPHLRGLGMKVASPEEVMEAVMSVRQTAVTLGLF